MGRLESRRQQAMRAVNAGMATPTIEFAILELPMMKKLVEQLHDPAVTDADLEKLESMVNDLSTAQSYVVDAAMLDAHLKKFKGLSVFPFASAVTQLLFGDTVSSTASGVGAVGVANLVTQTNSLRKIRTQVDLYERCVVLLSEIRKVRAHRFPKPDIEK
jgi:hypothetical protein